MRTVGQAEVYRPRLIFGVFTGYLACLFGVTIWFGLQNLREQPGYNIGDWLINFAGGFIRRGLPGEMALLLGRILHVSPSWVVFGVQLLLFAAIYVAVWKLVKPLHWHWWTAALAFSPATLGFVALVGGGAFRKELLFLAALAWLLVLVEKGLPESAILVYLSVTAIVVALSHEGLLVNWPYMIAAVALSRGKLRDTVKPTALPTLLVFGLGVLATHYSGSAAQAQAICSSVGGAITEIQVGLCGGSIYYLGLDSAYYRAEVVHAIANYHYFRDYGILLFLSLLPCVLGTLQIRRVSRDRFSTNVLVAAFVVSFLLTVPLFIMAIDWGRWIYIHVFSLMLLLFFLSAKEGEMAAQKEPRLGAPAMTLLVVYLLSWHMPVTGYERRGWGYLGMANRHLQRHLHHQAG